MPDVPLRDVEEFIRSDDPTDARTICTYVIGTRGQLTRKDALDAVVRVNRLLTRVSPHSPVMLTISGYDDDPRELYHIPETRQYLGWFAVEFDRAQIDEKRLLGQSRQMLQIGRLIAAGISFVLVEDMPEFWAQAFKN